MHRTIRSLSTLVIALSILLAVPISAGARGPEAPQPLVRTADGWMNAALGWLQDVLEAHHLVGRHHSPGVTQQKDVVGGGCIDPQGDRYPPPCIRG
jgi:hypothetical protein